MPAGDQIFDRIPVRSVFIGTQKNSDNSVDSFEHWYEFSHFRTKVMRHQVFEVNIIYYYLLLNSHLISNSKTPSTVFCPKRKATKPLPDISSHFSYSQEDVKSNEITYLTDVHYAYKYNLIRLESKDTEKSNLFYLS